MTIEQEIAKRKQPNKDESFISDYSLESDKIVFYNKGDDVEESFKYRDLMMDDYETGDDIVKNSLENVKSSLNEVWDDDIESFELERVTDTNEKCEEFLKELQFDIPTEDEYQPVTVLQIHNENEDFVANEIADRLDEVDTMKKFKTEKMYVDNPDEPKSIHEKVTGYTKSFKHYVNEKNHLGTYEENPSTIAIISISWMFFIGLFWFVTVPILIFDTLVHENRKQSKANILFMFAPIVALYYIIYHLLQSFWSDFSFKKEIVELT